MAGNRNNSNGSLNNVGSNGNYWSSSVSGSNARNLNFNSSNAGMNSNNRANGNAVRCLKDYCPCHIRPQPAPDDVLIRSLTLVCGHISINVDL